jgi:hypothetical protein
MPLDLKALIDGCNGKIALCDLREKAALIKRKGHEKSIWFRVCCSRCSRAFFGNDSALPDPKLTPGDSVQGATVEQLQEVGYSKHHRHVPEALRRAVFAEYGIPWNERQS